MERCFFLTLKRRFTCLDDSKDNIFLINEQDTKPLGCLYIPKISMDRLINEVWAKEMNGISGDIDDAVINFVAELLNFHQSYDTKKNLQGSDCPNNFFMGTYDDVHGINPNYAPERYKYLGDESILDETFQKSNKNETDRDIVVADAIPGLIRQHFKDCEEEAMANP